MKGNRILVSVVVVFALAACVIGGTNVQEPAVTKWEYRFSSAFAEGQKDFKTWGAEGWEYAGSFKQANQVGFDTLIFKRPLKR